MNKNTLVAAPAAGAKELKNQKAAKAKRIVVEVDSEQLEDIRALSELSSSDCNRVERLSIDTVSEYGV